MRYRHDLGGEYSPLYYLAALGSGGLTVSFFMYLMFMVPHPNTPIPTFEDLMATAGTGSLLMPALTVAAVTGVIIFAFSHFRLLIWNIKEYSLFKRTEQFQNLKKSNGEVQLMAIPLTYAMTINVMFILGALFVPKLWEIVEYLFPFALLGFLSVGIYAIKIFITFFSRVITFGQFDCEKNNSLSQMLSIFAFSMIAVGFAAPAAMSHTPLYSAIGILFSIGFIAITIVLSVIKIVLGFRAMFEHGINKESAVSLWILIPILTILGIALYRISMGLDHNFGIATHPWSHLMLFTVILTLQIFFGLLGFRVMRQIGYCKEFISGNSRSVVAYAAICPGVAFFVLGNFMLHKGLIAAGLMTQYSLLYWLLYLALLGVQLKTIQVLFRLNNKLLKATT